MKSEWKITFNPMMGDKIPALIMGKFKRWQGALLLAGYVTYVVLLILNTVGTISIF